MSSYSENKKISNSFLMQATILASAGIIVRIIGFLYRLPMQNMLGDEGTGIYGQGYNIYIFFFVLSSAGLPAAISKMVSTRIALKQYANAHKVFRVALVFSFFMGFIGTSILFFGASNLANFISSPYAYYSIKSLAPTVLIVSLMSVFRGYFQGMGNTVPTALSQIVEQSLNAIFSILLVYLLLDRGIYLAAAGGTAAAGIGALAGFILILFIYFLARERIQRKVIRSKKYEKYESNKSIAFELLSTALPIIAGTAIFSFMNIIDTRMVTRILMDIGFTSSEANVLFGQLNGKYVVITTLPVAIATAIATASIPNIATSVAVNDIKNVNNKMNLAIRLTMIICIPAAFGIFIFAQEILLFLFPNNPDGAILLRVGSMSIIFLALSQISTGMLQGMGKLKVPAISALFATIVKIPLNYFLISIPSINVVGAVISTTIAYMVASSINTTVAYKSVGAKLNFRSIFFKPLLCSLAMSLVSYFVYTFVYFLFSNNTIALLLAIFIGMIVYFAFMIIIKGIKKNDLEMIPMGNKIIKLLYKFNITV